MVKERAKRVFDAVWRGLFCGVVIGFIITFFVLGAEEIMSLVKDIFRISRGSPFLIVALFTGLIFIAFCINILFSFIPSIDGNYNERKAAKRKIVSRATDFDWLKTGIAYFISTYLSFLSGLPFGVERPSAYLGITLSRGIARYTGRKHSETVEVFGEAAAVAVAVRGPVTGCFYAIEEHLKKTKGKGLNPYLIFGVVLSSVSAYLMAYVFIKLAFGLKFSSFEEILFPYVSMKYVLYLVVLGVVLGFGSGLFFLLSKLCQSFFGKVNIKPFWLIAAAVIITAVIGLIDIGEFHGEELLGGGTNIIVNAAEENYSLTVLGIYFAVKFVIILIALCSGASGGVFIPSMVLGALTGGIMCRVFGIWGMPSEYFSSVILISAASFMGCYMHLPFTALFMSVELAGFNMFSDGYSFGLIFVSAIVMIISYSVSLLFEIRSLTSLRRISAKIKRQ